MLITHGLVATLGRQNRVIEDGAVMIEDGKITEVNATGEMKNKYPSAEELDANGMLVLPGAICAHTHFYGAFARGMYIPGEPACNFVQILEKLWWRLDLALDNEGTRLSALVCLVDAIRHGTTMLIDHHASPHAIEGSLDIIADAVKQSGLRAAGKVTGHELGSLLRVPNNRLGAEQAIAWLLQLAAGTDGVSYSHLEGGLEATGLLWLPFHVYLTESAALRPFHLSLICFNPKLIADFKKCVVLADDKDDGRVAVVLLRCLSGYCLKTTGRQTR
jgi:cytosine/adenosine deaminase-related metal-dependent hydrolase